MSGPLRDFVGYGNQLPSVTWPGKARVAVSVVVNFEEGAERSPFYGDPVAESMGAMAPVEPGRRDLVNESLFEYGARIGIWRLLDLFDRLDVKTTFFIAAKALEANPAAGRAITDRGHEAAGHGYQWLPTYALGEKEERRQLHLAVETIKKFTGQRPVGWYARSPSIHTRRLVVEEGGFLYDCNSFADDLPYFTPVDGRTWLIMPYSQETNDVKFTLAPGFAEPDDFFLQLKAAFDCLYQEGASRPKMLSVGLHLRTAGRPGAAAAFERFLRYVMKHPKVWISRRDAIARWWCKHSPDMTGRP